MTIPYSEAAFEELSAADREEARRLVAVVKGITAELDPRLNYGLNVYGGLLQTTCDAHQVCVDALVKLQKEAGRELSVEELFATPEADMNCANIVAVLLASEALLKELRAKAGITKS